jgi:polyisoprenoid-binding protein YceI
MTWTLDASAGELHILTDVAGRAARMGHRLTILVGQWHATVEWYAESPVAVRLTADVDSLAVESGEGGLTPLSGAERALARTNLLKALSAQRYPTVSFESDDITATDGGYLLTGAVEIHGHRRDQRVALDIEDRGDTWRLSSRTEVRQTDFGVKPYSMFMGALRVADAVTIAFSADRSKAG